MVTAMRASGSIQGGAVPTAAGSLGSIRRWKSLRFGEEDLGGLVTCTPSGPSAVLLTRYGDGGPVRTHRRPGHPARPTGHSSGVAALRRRRRQPGPPDAGQGRRPGGFCRSHSASPEHGVQPGASHAAQPPRRRRPCAGGVPEAVSQLAPAGVRGPPRSWLRRVASINASTRSGGGTIVRSSAPTRYPNGPGAGAARVFVAERLEALVAGLPERARMVVVLRYQEEMALTEIADVLGMPANTVRAIFAGRSWRCVSA